MYVCVCLYRVLEQGERACKKSAAEQSVYEKKMRLVCLSLLQKLFGGIEGKGEVFTDASKRSFEAAIRDKSQQTFARKIPQRAVVVEEVSQTFEAFFVSEKCKADAIYHCFDRG